MVYIVKSNVGNSLELSNSLMGANCQRFFYNAGLCLASLYINNLTQT